MGEVNLVLAIPVLILFVLLVVLLAREVTRLQGESHPQSHPRPAKEQVKMTESDREEGRFRDGARDLEYLDPYIPLSGRDAAPATGSAGESGDEITVVEEPIATGTLFLMVIFLMLTFGIWLVVYNLLLNR